MTTPPPSLSPPQVHKTRQLQTLRYNHIDVVIYWEFCTRGVNPLQRLCGLKCLSIYLFLSFMTGWSGDLRRVGGAYSISAQKTSTSFYIVIAAAVVVAGFCCFFVNIYYVVCLIISCFVC